MKILIRLPNWLGDLVMAIAFVEATQQLYPDSSIDIIVKKELASIAPMISGINKIYTFSKQEYHGLRGASRFGKTLKAEKYDIYFNLPASLSSMVMAWVTKAKRRVGFAREGGIFLLTNAYKMPNHLHRVRKYIFLLEKFSARHINNEHVSLNAEKLPDATARVLINFNSEAASRRMPIDKGKQLINLLTHTFPATTFTFIGAPKEKSYVDELLGGLDNPSQLENITGTTNLPQLCNIMAGSKVVLTTDSGPAHLANAVGAPCIVLFGAGNERETSPYNTKDLTIIRAGKLDCEPCENNVCKLYGTPKCMELLDDEKITNTLEKYI